MEGDDSTDSADDNIGPYYLAVRCPVCSSKSGLRRCSGCQVVSYCGVAHQSAHRPTHKARCTAIKKSREALEREAATLGAHPGDFMTPADVFNTSVGHFWGISSTRDYMRARFAAADALLRVDTVVAVKSALEHLTDMLRLNRSDNLGLRDIVPNLLLRLGREQECYDFLKWWARVANDSYDFSNVTLPYLDICNANAFEPLDKLSPRGLSLSQLASLTLLKLRMYLDLSVFKGEFAIRTPDPVIDRPVGRLVRGKMRSLSEARFEKTLDAVQGQYLALCQMVHDANPHFWGDLVDETDGTHAPPSVYSRGSTEEAKLALYWGRRAWHESEDAIIMVDADTSRFTRVHESSTGIAGASDTPSRDPETRARNLERRRGTGTVFPSVFRPPLPTSHPAELFPPTPMDRGPAIRFVSRDDPAKVLVYTDGACTNNGQPWSRAGWAVVYGRPGRGEQSSAGVVSSQLEDKGPFGDDNVATSNRAELRAIIAALRLCDWRGDGFDSMVIATDSSYVVDGATGWVKGWLRNGWTTRTGGSVKNRDLWDLLLGEVERWKDHGLHVEFWKIPRALNGDADGAAKRAISKEPADTDFRDIAITPSEASAMDLDQPPLILALCLDSKDLFLDSFRGLVSQITSKATMELATTEDAALAMLGEKPPPSVVLVADGAVTRKRKILGRVIDLLRGGTTVVLAGCFSSMTTQGQFSRLFATIGLPWEPGSYQRETVRLHRDAVGDQLANRLPSSYSQKAAFLKNVDQSAAWYTAGGIPSEAAIAFAKVGLGYLGYVGDVNAESGSDAAVLAMCGLLN